MPWHLEPNQDLPYRRQMINLVANFLDRKHSNSLKKSTESSADPKTPSSDDHQSKLVAAARRLEVALYKASKTKDEYMDTMTLSNRIVELEKSGNFGVNPPGANSTAKSVASTSADLTDVYKQRRSRLLLLKHASKCNLPEGTCSYNWCPQMKKLWNHVAQCKKQNCTVPHCISSHYVLTHYKYCKDKDCPVCKPVREESRSRAPPPSDTAGQEQAFPKPPDPKHLVAAAPVAPQAETPKVAANPNKGRKEAIDPRFARGSRDGNGPSLPLSMDKADVELHLESLKIEQLQQVLSPLLRKIMENTKANGGVFNEPVDPVALNIPDYFNVIKNPMDLGTVRRHLENGSYTTQAEFEADVRLVFSNATTFNPATHVVHIMANQLKSVFEGELKKLGKQKVNDLYTGGKKGAECTLCKQTECEKCNLCDRGCIAFEPKILYCAGTCNQRINRNSTFYSAPGTSISWCQECFDKRKNDMTLEDVSSGVKYSKDKLIRRKHDELFGEPWVCCDTCGRWCHQTCAMFNQRKQNPENREDKYSCPKCLVKDDYVKAPPVPDAAKLKTTRLSTFLERWVRTKLSEAYEKEKENPARAAIPPLSSDTVMIRVLSNCDEVYQIKPFAKAMNKEAPENVPYRSRAIFVFQRLDGVDVLLFVMYVQEYGSDAPPPNRGKVYIAYLDSVHFFRPRQFRTLVYHELLLSYLEYARRSAFTSCYIWACPPPTKKDDYILHCHPEEQRVPSHERLRSWYHEMIKRGVEQGVVLSSCALFEEHFEDSLVKKTSTTSKRRSKGGKGKSSSSKATTKIEPPGTATKPKAAELVSQTPTPDPSQIPVGMEDGDLLDDFIIEGDHEPQVAASPAPPSATPTPTPPPPQRFEIAALDDTQPIYLGLRKGDLDNMSPEELERRRTNKLATSFRMPAFEGDFWPNEYEEVALDKARKARDSRNVPGASESKKVRTSSANMTPQSLIAEGVDVDPKTVINRIGESLEHMKADFLVVKLAHECSSCGEYLLRGRWECRHPSCLAASGFNRPSPFALCNDCFGREIEKPIERQHGCIQQQRPTEALASSTVNSPKENPRRESDDDETTGGSESDEKNPRSETEEEANWEKQVLGCTRLAPEKCSTESHQLFYVDERLPLKTPRSDEVKRNALLETRHAFLSLCTGNRYAFNQLRRAKHTTMMVLYHLHNPDAPAHLYSCNMCGDDIISGYRYNCSLCQGGDFDLCVRCKPSANHPHPLTAIEVTKNVDQEGSEQKRTTNLLEQRRQRQRSLQVFLAALVHASSCKRDDCPEAACTKMKELLAHRQRCTTRVRGGCEICRRVLCLVQMHARGTEHQPPCEVSGCQVPHCEDLKKHLRAKAEGGGTTPGQHPGAPTPGSAPKRSMTKKNKGEDGPKKKGEENKKKRTHATANAPQEGKEGLKIKLKVNKPAVAAPVLQNGSDASAIQPEPTSEDSTKASTEVVAKTEVLDDSKTLLGQDSASSDMEESKKRVKMTSE